ncbi:MAG: hypothetical protein HKN47_29700, partial [Pirellulaceae bacterium]|nr:hypothetical protein [Pirellulaceae bacterium]
ASSIASFVAFAVEDLRPEAVQITDKEGRSYTVPDEQVHQINSQVEYIAELESKLSHKAETQLLHFLGYGNASVQVSLDMTFTQGSTTITKYDPDGKVAADEDLVSETTTNAEAPTEGAAGVASNLQTRRRSGSNVESKTENIKTTYLVPKTEETQANSTPVRNFMSVSVLVNSAANGIQQEDGTLPAGLDEKVTAIVKNAVGFRTDTDTISVEFFAFPQSEFSMEPVAVPFDWARLAKVVESASLAVAALLAFVMGFLLLRKIQPMTSTDNSVAAPQMDRERMENVNQLSDLIKEHPEVFTQIVRSWSGVDNQETSSQSKAA